MSVVTDLFVGLVERLVLPRLDPLARYPATVTTQHEDGSLDVKPDDRRFGAGLSRVPVRHGLPGVTARVRVGARVMLAFEGGDTSRPYVPEFEAAGLESITVEASTKILLKAPSVIAAEVEANARPVARVGDLVKMTFINGAPTTPNEAVGYIMDGAKKLSGE